MPLCHIALIKLYFLIKRNEIKYNREIIMDYPGGPEVITMIFNSAEGSRRVQVRKDVRTEAEVRVTPCEGGSILPC